MFLITPSQSGSTGAGPTGKEGPSGIDEGADKLLGWFVGARTHLLNTLTGSGVEDAIRPHAL